MKWNRLGRAICLFTGIVFAGAAHATTYYVDYSTGNDQNNGTSTATPWQHAPGMVGCVHNCSIAPAPGDKIILKGGVTWPNGTMSWNISFSGSASNPIYFGVNQTWYTGSSWTRPILNAGGDPVTGNGNTNTFINLTGNYVQLDNFEFTGMFFNDSYSKYGDNSYINKGGSTHSYITNNYFHNWSWASGSKLDGLNVILGSTTDNYDIGSYAAYNVFDGSDSEGPAGRAIYGSPGVVYGNYCGNMSNCFVLHVVSVHDNLIENLQMDFEGGHPNAIESTTDDAYGWWAGGGYSGIGGLIYNNVVRHLGSGVVGIWDAPNSSNTSYVFNNVEYDTAAGNVLNITPPNGNNTPGGTFISNNTIECGPDSNPSAACSNNVDTKSTSNFYNNHYITNNTAPNNGPAIGTDTYVLQSKAVANDQGYTSEETPAFSPAGGSDATVGAGKNNQTSTCNLNSLLVALCQDTTYAVSYDQSTHTVTYPARPTRGRPSSGSWDAGAYQFSAAAATGSTPAPPQGLAATVN